MDYGASKVTLTGPNTIRSPYQRDASAMRELNVATAFCSLLALGMTLVYAALRTGFGVDWLVLGRILGFGLQLINFPFYWSRLLGARGGGDEWYRSAATGGIVCIAASQLMGWSPFAGAFGAALSILGYVGAFGTVFLLISRGSLRFNAGFFSVLIIALAWCAGVSWGAGFENPLYLEDVALHGRSGSVDIFFHSSLANMISLYSIPSTGVDGVIRIPYHFGSHWIFSRWADLIGIPAFDFYQIGYPVIVPALWFTALTAMVLEVRRWRSWATENSFFHGLVVFILAASVIGSFPQPMRAALGFGIGPFFSESYAITLVVLFFLGGKVFSHLATVRSRGARPHDAGRIGEYALSGFVLPAGIVALGLLKVSTFLFTIPALLYGIFRLGLYRRLGWVVSALLTTGAALLVMPQLQAHNRFEFSPFGYLRYQLPLRWWPYFLTLHFFWTWVFVMVRLRQEGVTNSLTLRAALKRRSILDVEIITLTSLGCLLPGLLLPLPIEAIYFTDQIRWLSVALLLGNLWFLSRVSARVSEFREWGVFGFRPPQILATFVGVPLFLSFVITLLGWPISMVRMNLTTRKEISVLSGQPLVSLRERVVRGHIADLADPTMLRKGLASAPGGGVIAALRSVSAIPLDERRKTALYIPQRVSAFWGLLRSDANCRWAAFVAPALAGVQLIDGFPPMSCGTDPTWGFGLEAYSAAALMPRVAMRTDPELCSRALRSGVERILILEPDSAPSSATSRDFGFRRLVCGNNSPQGVPTRP